jgi:hypothetical protein
VGVGEALEILAEQGPQPVGDVSGRQGASRADHSTSP